MSEKSLTKGTVALRAFLAGDNPQGRPITLAEAARALGVSDVTVMQWRDGDSRPAVGARREAIFRWTGKKIREDDWRDDAEIAAHDAAAQVEAFGKKSRSVA